MCGLCIAIGIVLGIGLTLLTINLRHPNATFLIDQSDPDKDSYNLNLRDLDSLPKKRFILVKIVKGNSQK